MNRYLLFDMGAESKSIESILTWIDKVIQTSTRPEHREVCEQLITNFTNTLLFNQDYSTYTKIESILRKSLSKKFQNT